MDYPIDERHDQAGTRIVPIRCGAPTNARRRMEGLRTPRHGRRIETGAVGRHHPRPSRPANYLAATGRKSLAGMGRILPPKRHGRRSLGVSAPPTGIVDDAIRRAHFENSPNRFQAHRTISRTSSQLGLVRKKIRARKLETSDVSVLNLFGYTGAATLASAAAGASVCHVDASKGVVQWCRENAALSKLNDAPIRYIADDCLKFTAREARRGRHYDGIILDPPAYGRGAAGEIWKIEEDLWPLLLECRALLSERPLFLIINSYASKLSPLLIGNLLTKLMAKHGGRVTVGELGLPSPREEIVLPCGICGRWESE